MAGFQHDIAGGSGDLVATSVQSPNFVHGVSGWQIARNGSAEFQDIILPAGSSFTATFSATAPPSPGTGDLWYDTASGLEVSQWNGSAWVAYRIGAGALASGIVYAGIVDSTTISSATINGSTFNGTDFVFNSSGQFFYGGSPAAGNLILSVTNGTGTDAKGNAYLEGTTSYTNNGSFYSAVNLNGGVAAWYVSTSAPYYGGPWVSAGGIGVGYSSGPTYTMVISGQNYINLEAQTEVTLGLLGNCVWNEGTQQLSLPASGLLVNSVDLGSLVAAIVSALSGQATTTNGLANGTINGSSSSAGLTNGTIAGTSGAQSTGTAHTHSAGSYAVNNGQHSHTGGSYAVTNGTHAHDLPTV